MITDPTITVRCRCGAKVEFTFRQFVALWVKSRSPLGDALRGWVIDWTRPGAAFCPIHAKEADE